MNTCPYCRHALALFACNDDCPHCGQQLFGVRCPSCGRPTLNLTHLVRYNAARCFICHTEITRLPQVTAPPPQSRHQHVR